MIVMEKVKGAKIDSYLRQRRSDAERVLSHCAQALDTLHRAGFCHGDFRAPNLLVKEDDDCKICLLDFEWAGPAGRAKYPLMMNHVDIEWPDGAISGGIIQEEHDTCWLQKLRYPNTYIIRTFHSTPFHSFHSPVPFL